MIPHRLFSNELQGNGVRDRVSACRKRMRETRTTATAARAEVENLFSETSSPATARGLEVNADEVLLGIEGQEVGIT